jgi:hypothetical protein
MKKKLILILLTIFISSCKNEKKEENKKEENKIEVIEEIGDNYSTKPEYIGKQVLELFREFGNSERIANPMEHSRFKKHFCTVEELRNYGKDNFEFGSKNQNYFTSISNSEYYGNINSEFSKLWKHLFKDRNNRIFISGDLELLDFFYKGNKIHGTDFIEGIVTIKVKLYDYNLKIKTTSVLIGNKYKLIRITLA